ncbi:MAG: hypothetical protein M3R38_17085 [Actinomycetota bacterium]|nr:hypothetical protein [Actinomycetota bacterium]
MTGTVVSDTTHDQSEQRTREPVADALGDAKTRHAGARVGRSSVVSRSGTAGEAERRLVVDLAMLRRDVISLPEPDPEELGRARSGAALLSALMHESSDFGEAAPGVPSGAPLADSILAITDEALEAAYDILERAQEEERMGAPVTRSGTLSGAVAEALDAGLFSTLFSGLAALPAAPDLSVAAEFV